MFAQVLVPDLDSPASLREASTNITQKARLAPYFHFDRAHQGPGV